MNEIWERVLANSFREYISLKLIAVYCMTDMSRPDIEPGLPLAVSTDGERALCIPPYIDSCHLIDLVKDAVVHHEHVDVLHHLQ
jgi:hypothetical protein